MSNYFGLFYYFCLNFLLFCESVRSESVHHNQQRIIHVADSQLSNIDEDDRDPDLNGDNSPNRINYGNFITGLWRGFHQFEGLTIYYGYQFRRDGSFLARHRIYQDSETLEDITWQGQWQFRDDRLTLKGFNSKDKTQQATLEFKLTDTFKLAYETGSLSQPYNQMILSKLGGS